MFNYFKLRLKNFSSDSLQWGSCLLNIILCLCMGYFYFDSDLIVPLFYSVFFLFYIIVVFFSGRRCIPVLYMLYCFGGVQDITFINLTGWFIIVGLYWWFPKWKYPLIIVYALEIFFVCFRHSKSVWHLLAHFAFCVVFYVSTEHVKNKIQKEAVERAGEALRGLVEKTIENDIKASLREDLRVNMKRLELTEGERAVVSQLAEGKMIKEVEGVSKNTKTDYIEAAMLRNGCRTKAELISLYSLEERLPELFPSLFPEN
ncbi:helix-turn-helix transcriptional regulator [Carnobacterium sp.]|uniref:helix-turn-helix transcriptional regulator n=1 Tax=Carnobacterium sp. TaxID=48221 RepID=UPI00388D1FFB